MALREVSGRDPNYEFVSHLGEGGFGSVAKVRRVSDGKIMACKAIDCTPHPNIKKFAYRELEAVASFALSERYIANFAHDATWTDETQTIKLYMKYYEGGDLQGVINSCRHQSVQVHPFIATYWALEVAKGVKACHDHGIIHRDLKPANVLLAMQFKFNDMLWTVSDGKELTDKQRSLAKEFLAWLETRPAWCHITDFGLGKLTPTARHPQNFTPASFASGGILGTPGFMAPETIGPDIQFSVKSDIYSLGCLLYSLCSCRPPPPIPATSSPEAGAALLRIPECYPKRLRDIIAQCMQRNPDDRPDSWEVTNEINEACIDVLQDDKFGNMRAKLLSALGFIVTRSRRSSGESYDRQESNPGPSDVTSKGKMRNPRDGEDKNEEDTTTPKAPRAPVANTDLYRTESQALPAVESPTEPVERLPKKKHQSRRVSKSDPKPTENVKQHPDHLPKSTPNPQPAASPPDQVISIPEAIGQPRCRSRGCSPDEYLAIEAFRDALFRKPDLEAEISKLVSLQLVNVQFNDERFFADTTPRLYSAYGWTPLIGCIAAIRFEAAKALILAGADLSLHNPLLLAILAFRDSHAAIKRCRAFMKSQILIDPRPPSEYFQQELIALIHFMVEAGADLDRAQFDFSPISQALVHEVHMTPLHGAVDIEYGALVEYLLRNGADGWLRDSEGKTPLDRAKASKNKELIRILEDAGYGRKWADPRWRPNLSLTAARRNRPSRRKDPPISES
ncbi:G2-specific serine/threonine protein kinase [Orbilia brochopaga]|uniref:non-specific serine/threonine protein kinase n=1 Tax=Orbilia brochopaga TaxID=3140254 RepID=A0AAV9UT80_9PEZI